MRLGAAVGFAVSLAACAASAPPPVAPPAAAAASAPPPTAVAAPRVLEDIVTVFPGDDFFIAADERNGALFNLRVVPPPTEPTQKVLHVHLVYGPLKMVAGGPSVMLLAIESRFTVPLVYRALMQPVGVPRNLFRQTSTCPIVAGGSATEMWPNAMTAIKLLNFRVAQQPGVCKEY